VGYLLFQNYALPFGMKRNSSCEQKREFVGLFTDPAIEYVTMLVSSQPQNKFLMFQLTEQQRMTNRGERLLFLTYKSL